jgi:hypothetical protein
MVLATFLSLWPFGFEWDCLICRNGAAIDSAAGHLSFQSRGLARASVPDGFVQALVESDALVLELWVTPTETGQTGPARIISFSSNPFRQNFMVGQDHDALVVRLRTAASDVNGLRGQIEIGGVFAAGAQVHITIRTDAEGTSITINEDAPRTRSDVRADFSSWSEAFDLVIGNEATGDRPWLGSIEAITLRGAEDQRLADFDFGREAARPGSVLGPGDLILPNRVLNVTRLGDDDFKFADLALHFAMLFPVGLLGHVVFSRGGHVRAGLILPALAIVAFAGFIEFLQFFSVARTMSALDLFWGVLGGMFGIAAGNFVLQKAGRA